MSLDLALRVRDDGIVSLSAYARMIESRGGLRLPFI